MKSSNILEGLHYFVIYTPPLCWQGEEGGGVEEEHTINNISNWSIPIDSTIAVTYEKNELRLNLNLSNRFVRSSLYSACLTL